MPEFSYWLILRIFRGAPVLILKLFPILVNFRGAPVKKSTLYDKTSRRIFVFVFAGKPGLVSEEMACG